MADKKTPSTRKAPASKAKPAPKKARVSPPKADNAATESPTSSAKASTAKAAASGVTPAKTSETTKASTAKTSGPEAKTATDKAAVDAKPDTKSAPKTDDKPATAAVDAKSDNGTTDKSTPKAAPDASAPEKTASDDSHSMLVPVPEAAPRRGGFGGLVLGGVIAALIGAGAAYVVLPRLGLLAEVGGDVQTRDALAQLESRLDEQAARLSGVDERLKAAGDTTDIVANTASVGDLNTRIATLADTLAATESRLTALEERPAVVDGTGEGSGPTLGDVAALRQSLAEQQAQITSLISEAAHQEELALASSRETLQRAAMTRIHTALDSGTGFAAPLADLEALGQSIPDDLRAAAAEGVPTLVALQETYPEAARAALATARKSSEDTGGMMGFLNAQLGVRSLEPREGNDPDAILSRAEAALNAGRLTDTLAEIDALPEIARTELSDWAGLATSRLTAVHAAEALGDTLN